MTSKTVPTCNEPPERQEDAIRHLPPEPTSLNSFLDTHHDDPEAEETTPLIRRATSDAERNAPSRASKRSWWTIISIAILLVITVNIIVFAFVIPSAAQ